MLADRYQLESLISHFLIGLLGAAHCFGMCGGISSLLTLGLAPQNRRGATAIYYLLAYNGGRLSSYVAAGAIVGGLSGGLLQLSELHQMQRVLQLLAGGVMVLLGLYIADLFRGISHLENLGGYLWRYLKPLGQRFLPVTSWWSALFLGVIWGWLPCGLVYSALIATLGSGSSAQGAWLMLSFGLGTLPALLGMGLFAAALGRYLQKRAVRLAAGCMVIGLAIYQMAAVF